MKIEIINTEEHRKLRTEFNEETGIYALIDNQSYINWLEKKLVKNTKELITKHEKSIAILEGIQHFETMIKHTNNSVNGFGGSFKDLREKYINKIDTYNRCIERLYSRYNNLP